MAWPETLPVVLWNFPRSGYLRRRFIQLCLERHAWRCTGCTPTGTELLSKSIHGPMFVRDSTLNFAWGFIDVITGTEENLEQGGRQS